MSFDGGVVEGFLEKVIFWNRLLRLDYLGDVGFETGFLFSPGCPETRSSSPSFLVQNVSLPEKDFLPTSSTSFDLFYLFQFLLSLTSCSLPQLYTACWKSLTGKWIIVAALSLLHLLFGEGGVAVILNLLQDSYLCSFIHTADMLPWRLPTWFWCWAQRKRR